MLDVVFSKELLLSDQKIVVVSVSNLRSALFILWLSWGGGRDKWIGFKPPRQPLEGKYKNLPLPSKIGGKIFTARSFQWKQSCGRNNEGFW